MRVNPGETVFSEGPPASVGMADGPSAEENETEVREVASKVVDDIIHRATIEANDRQGEDQPVFPVLPAIQIDVVASRTPSPDSLTDDTTGNTCMENTKNGKQVQESSAKVESPKDTKQLREFARTYLQDIFSKAVQVAEERSQQKMGTMRIAEETQSKKSTVSPWYIRVGESLVRFIRIACLCGGRRNNS